MLGVSRQRVDQLASTTGFPAPVAELSAGRVWETRAIEGWIQTDPGRTAATRRAGGRPVGAFAVFGDFTDAARRVIVFAQEEARELRHGHIGTEHLLLGLMREQHAIAQRALASVGATLDAARSKVEDRAGRGEDDPPKHLPFTVTGKAAVERSAREAQRLGHGYIGPEHLLLALLEEDGQARAILSGFADLDDIRDRVLELVEGSGPQLVGAEIAPEGENLRLTLVVRRDISPSQVGSWAQNEMRHYLETRPSGEGDAGEAPPDARELARRLSALEERLERLAASPPAGEGDDPV